MLTMDTYYYGHQSFAISRLIYVIFVRFLAAKISLTVLYVCYVFFLSFHHIGSIITDCTYNWLVDFFNGHSHHTKYDEQTST